MRTKYHAFINRNLCHLGLALAALGGLQVAHAQNPANYGSFVTSGGIQVWTGPGPVVTKPPTGVNWSRVFQQSAGAATDVIVKDTGAVALRNGASVALTASRLVTGANILAATRALAGGPVGLALLVGIPAFQLWVNQNNTRMGSGVGDKPFEVLDTQRTCVMPPDKLQGYPAWVQSYAQTYIDVGGQGYALTKYENNVCIYGVRLIYPRNNVDMFIEYWSAAVTEGVWVPASMDDIAPYLEPRPVTPAYLPALLDSGAKVNSTPNGITGPTTAPAEPPVKNTTQVPTPPVSTTTTYRPGNPSGLAPNAPTVTSETTGSTPTTVNGKPVNQPNKTVTESTYDPDTNRTSDTTTTTHTPIRVEETTSNTTNITYNTNTATATTTSTTTTTVINNTTNNVINNTTTGGDVKPSEEATDPCKQNPDALMCAKPDLDTPDGEIPKVSKTVTYTEESIFGSGSCPADKIVTLHTGQSLKVWDFAKTCEVINTGVAPIFLLAAAYSAFLILALGKADI